MSYKDQKTNIELDDMNIKLHLNTSLELNDISVSEDLINRTLNVIKNMETGEERIKKASVLPINNAIPWNRYIRNFAGVAAAALIVAVGFNLLSTGSKKMDMSTTDSAAPEMASESKAGDMEQYSMMEGTSESTAAPEENVKIFSDKDDVSMKSSLANGETEDNSSVDARLFEQDAGTKEIVEPTLLSLRDLISLSSEDIDYIVLSNLTTDVRISIKEPSLIQEFYLIMDQNQFTYSDSIENIHRFSIEIVSSKSSWDSTVLLVGDRITVQSTTGNTVNEAIYEAVNSEMFLTELENFIQKHNN